MITSKKTRRAITLRGLLISSLIAATTCLTISTDVAANSKHHININKLADAIYWAEGGRKARVPYGILSVPVSGYREARQVCIRTIESSYRRWNGKGRFIVHLSNTYCPRSISRKGNDNWNKNVRYYYFNPKPIQRR